MSNPHRETHRMIQRSRVYRNASRRGKVVMLREIDKPSRYPFYRAFVGIAEAAYVVNDALADLTVKLRQLFLKEKKAP